MEPLTTAAGRVADAGYGGHVVLDNSAWARLVGGRVPAAIRDRWICAIERDEVVISDPFRLEALYSARDADAFVRLTAELDAMAQAPCDDEVWQLARRAQAELAVDRRVSHRVAPVDLLVAAAAHRHALGVLHYDHDFDILEKHTSLDFRSCWLAKRGSLD